MSQAEREYVEIREVGADQAALLAQFEQVGLPDAWSEDEIRKLLENGCRHAYVALRRGTPAAYCLIQAVEDEGEVLRVVTLPEWRRKGIAARLLAEAEKRSEAVKCWNLEVREHNLPALGLYEKAGYRGIRLRPAYYTDTKEAAVCMQKLSAPAEHCGAQQSSEQEHNGATWSLEQEPCGAGRGTGQEHNGATWSLEQEPCSAGRGAGQDCDPAPKKEVPHV
ncbi:MAG: GNAT family N-acetyltransferase [Lachnospiraceae bacterium]|nr:GNAT family N-acetyltransferase [Lachnospiraceae bacterium]